MKKIILIIICCLVGICVGLHVSSRNKKIQSAIDSVRSYFTSQSTSEASVSSVKLPDAKIKAPITRLLLFKNGIACVTRQLNAPSWDKPVELDAELNPLHGTVWFTPAGTEFRRIEHSENLSLLSDPAKISSLPLPSFLKTYIGQQVDIKLKDGSMISGIVMNNSPSGDLTCWSIRKNDGSVTTLMNPQEIFSIEAKSPHAGILSPIDCPKKISEIYQITAPAGHQGPVSMDTLEKNVFWAPSYRIDISDDKKLSISMSAEIINQLEDFTDAEVQLITGFPNIKMQNAVSPLKKNQSYTSFLSFDSYSSRYSSRSSSISSQIASNSISPNSFAMNESEFPQEDPDAEKIDMAFLPAGKLSMTKNSVLHLPVEAPVSADYERLLSCDIGSFGCRTNSSTLVQDYAVMDAVRFRNPFTTAITTAPVEFVSHNHIIGQSVGSWVAPSAITVFPITKALNLSVIAENSRIASKSFKNVSYTYTNLVESEHILSVNLQNTRAAAQKFLISANVSGTVSEVSDNPSRTQVAQRNNDYDFTHMMPAELNPVQRLTWEITIEPGEKKKLTCKFTCIHRQ